MKPNESLDESSRASLYYTVDMLLESVAECAGRYGMGLFALIDYWQLVTIHLTLGALDEAVLRGMDDEQKIAHLVAMLPHHEAGVRSAYRRYRQQLEDDASFLDGPCKRARDMMRERAFSPSAGGPRRRLH